MLHAVLNGKAGRVALDGQDVSWRELFRKREDLLTAAFFGRLMYLQSESQTALIEAMIPSVKHVHLGKLRKVEFWPHFETGVDDGLYVEPDVLLHFENLLLVVEIKPPQSGRQKLGQWSRQIKGILAERDNESPIWMLALGRNHSKWHIDARELESTFSSDGIKVFTCEWQSVLNFVHERQVKKSGSPEEYIMKDWLDILSLYGMVRPRKPFSDLIGIQLSRFHEAINDIEKIKINGMSIVDKGSEMHTNWVSLCEFIGRGELN